MLAAAYLLFVISNSGMPALTALAAYETKAACDAAAETVNKALSSGGEPQKVVCISADSLEALGKANDLH